MQYSQQDMNLYKTESLTDFKLLYKFAFILSGKLTCFYPCINL
jgi:hypothetical protein